MTALNVESRHRHSERLRKLLHLAENAGSEGEALAAATAAAKLMASHGLSPEDASTTSREPGRASIDAVDIVSFGTRAPSWLEVLSAGICRLSGCFAWVVTTRKHRDGGGRSQSESRLRAAGRADDLSIARALVPAFAELVREFGTRRHRRRRGRAAYRLGLALGLLERMESVQNLVLERVRRSSRNALEPLDRVALAQRTVGLDDIRKARPAAISDRRSLAIGMRDARDIKLPGQHHALCGQLALTEAI